MRCKTPSMPLYRFPVAYVPSSPETSPTRSRQRLCAPHRFLGAGDSRLLPTLPPALGSPLPGVSFLRRESAALVLPLHSCTAVVQFSGSAHKDAPVQRTFCPVSYPTDNTSHSGGSGWEDGPCLCGLHSALHFLPFLAQSPTHKSTFIGGIGALHLGAKNSIGSFSWFHLLSFHRRCEFFSFTPTKPTFKDCFFPL